MRIGGAALGKRAHLDRIHRDKGRLNELFLNLLIKGLIQGVAPGLVHAVHINADAFGKRDALFIVPLDRHKVCACDLLDRVRHRETAPGGREVDLLTEPVDPIGAQDLLGGAGKDAFQNIHHAVKVGEGLIQLAGGELGIVLGVHALVAENASDFIDALQTADDQTLEMQLGGDTHIHIDIERVVMGDKRTRVGAAGNGAEDGSFHFHEAHIVQIPAEVSHELTADLKVAPALGIHDEVHIALTVAGFLIGQTVEFFRQRLERLAQKPDLPHTHAHLAALGTEHLAVDADDVADVVLSEFIVNGLVHLVTAGVKLDTSGLVLQVAEADLAHAALGHQTTADGHALAFELVKVVLDVLRMMRDIKAGLKKRILARVLQGLQLFAAHPEDLGKLLLRCGTVLVLLFSHRSFAPILLHN